MPLKPTPIDLATALSKGMIGNPNVNMPVPNSPWPAMSQDNQNMFRQNDMLDAIQVQGLDAWNRIKAGKGAPGDAQTLAVMVGHGLDGGASEGDWPKMVAAAKRAGR